ncbi:DUF1349 domain-containing protein [Singulisphaera rosea]
MSYSPTVKSKTGSIAGDDKLRAPGAPPQLLSEIPGSAFTSPGFIVGIIVAEFLYGLVFFAVMSGKKKAPVEADLEPIHYSVSHASKASPKVEATVASKVEPKSTPTAATTTSSQPNPSSSVANSPEPAPTPQPAPTTTPEPPKPPTLAAAIPTPTDLPPEAPAKEISTLGPLGPIIDPLNDCKVSKEGRGIEIFVPASLHVLDPTRGIADSPRALVEVNGDFVAQVKVPGMIEPGTASIGDWPLTFQGAGLLLWQDENNFVRLERAAGYSVAIGAFHRVMVESCKDGKPGRGIYLATKEGNISLRMERKGNDITCSYNTDGKTWLPVKKAWSVTMASRLKVGISASNISAKPFGARFEEFSLRKGGSR